MRHASSSPAHSFTRRDALRLSGMGALAVALTEGSFISAANAAAAPATATALEPLNRFPRMVQEYFEQRLREVESLGDKRRNALRSKRDAEAYVREVRKNIQHAFGPWPERTPLNPRVTGTVERDTYKIEKVIFESRPNFLVTANLYLPKNGGKRAPGVIGTCGHSITGKAVDAYQSFAQGLARQGYVVLIFDPIGQGERFQYLNEKLGTRLGGTVQEHLYAGNQQFLVGDFLGSWRAWDGIRALDYLLTRPEVDPKQVGVTGNSGGGTMTTWLCGVESRWTMAAPACFVTTFRRNLENELPADTEQCPPRALALGLDHSDFIAAMAPKPVVLLGKERDFFDVRGIEEAYRRLKKLYQLLGAEQNISLAIGPTYHGYSQENRESMYRWFNHVTKVSDAQTEPALTIEKDETLWCTPEGQVGKLNSRTVFSFTQEKSRALAGRRSKPSGDQLKRLLTQTLNLPERKDVAEYRILRAVSGRKHPKKYFAAYTVQTEPGIEALVYRLYDEAHYSRPLKDTKRAILYVSHQGADAELREEPLLAELLKAEPQAAFYTCDVRGIGESRPNTCGQNTFLDPYGCDFFYAIHGIMLDEPYVGRKTHDVLRVLDWLVANGHTEIHLTGKGWGSIPATFAAVLHDQVKQVTLKNALTSYSAIAESVNYKWPLSTLLRDVLLHFDLPDCYRELQSKQLKQIDPWGPLAG